MMRQAFQTQVVEAGCDEAGRGCLAGPVVGAAVALPRKYYLPGLNDSKKVSEKKRLVLQQKIEQQALAWAVGYVYPPEIDTINILNAAIQSMHLALSKLMLTPGFILVDGNRFKPFNGTPFKCVIKGDAQFAHIAAASILAKTYRDAYMKKHHIAFPHYGWASNKGYPTKKHRAAIARYGSCPHHRKSFKLLPKGELF